MTTIVMILCSVLMLAVCMRLTLFFLSIYMSWPACVCVVIMCVALGSSPVSGQSIESMAVGRFVFSLAALAIIGALYAFRIFRTQLIVRVKK